MVELLNGQAIDSGKKREVDEERMKKEIVKMYVRTYLMMLWKCVSSPSLYCTSLFFVATSSVATSTSRHSYRNNDAQYNVLI